MTMRDITFIGSTTKQKEEELEESLEEEEETQQVMGMYKSQVSIGNIMYIALVVVLYFIFNFVEYWGSLIGVWITTGVFALDSTSFITFIVDLGLFLIIIALLIYYPRLSRKIVEDVFISIVALVIALITMGVLRYFEITLLINESPFSLFNMVIFLPMLFYFCIISYKHNQELFHNFIFLLALVLCFSLIYIMEYETFVFYFENYLFLIAIIVFQVMVISQNYSLMKNMKVERIKSVKKLNPEDFV